MSDPELDAMAGGAEWAALAMIDDLRAAAARLDNVGRDEEADEKRDAADAMEKVVAKLRQARSAKEEQHKFVQLVALIRKYRAASKRTGKKRPALIDVAEEFGWTSEQPLRDYCRKLGIREWHVVHDLVAAATD